MLLLLLLLLLRESVPWIAHVPTVWAHWSCRWIYEGSLSYSMARPRPVDLGGVFLMPLSKKNVKTIENHMKNM